MLRLKKECCKAENYVGKKNENEGDVVGKVPCSKKL